MRSVVVFLALVTLSAHAYEARYVKGQVAADLETVLIKANEATRLEFKLEDFYQIEDRDLSTSHYTMWVQMVEGVPVAKTAIRFWTANNELIQGELHLDEKTLADKARLSARFRQAGFTKRALGSQRLAGFINKMVSESVKHHTLDSRIIDMKSRDEWRNGDLVRVVEVRARRGVHTITVSLLQGKVIERDYHEFQTADQTFEANVFAMYEEVEGTGERLPTVPAQLKYVNNSRPLLNYIENNKEPYAALRARRYFEIEYNPIWAMTPQGRERGAWSSEMLRSQADQIATSFPMVANNFETGVLLRGRYVNINLHPDVAAAFPKIDFALQASAGYMARWFQNEDGFWEVVPTSGFEGKAIRSNEDLLSRVPVRLADHDTTSYINNGFDEIQVYYSVTTFMDALVEMGFTDPEFSTKAFEAFLFDPDIGMRDNAYYTDNTINFTTYSPSQLNYARDNATIWHELGHGIMDRVMGPFLRLADTGGLSEGMADFLAMLVVQHQTNGADFPGRQNFRIINETGFYLTNEVHDDGEAYGGTMNDILDAFMARDGRQGLIAMTDLTMETMRLTRNHPGLTAQVWFQHMIYADELGSSLRPAGAYKELILSSLAGRNFTFDESVKRGNMKIMVGTRELTSENEGSRENPIKACSTTGVVAYDLNVSLEQGAEFSFKFPVTVKVEFLKGALQGAVRWEGEEQNPLVYTLNSVEEVVALNLKASMNCDAVNQPDGSCKDYAYIQVFNDGETRPRAKKRFYLKIKDGQTDCP